MAVKKMQNQGPRSGPAGEGRVQTGSRTAKYPKDTKALRVALVCEEAGTEEGLRKMIAMHAPGWTLDTYASPRSASALAQHVAEGAAKKGAGPRPAPLPDVLLIALGERDLSAFQWVRKFKAVWPAVPLVAVAKRSEAGVIAEALMAGACGYLVQPVPPHELLSAIRDAMLGRPALCREAQAAMLGLISCAGEGASGALTRREQQMLTCLPLCPLLHPGSPASLHNRCSRSSRCLSALSEREEQVVLLLESGMAFKQIEDRLHLGHSLVNKLGRRIFKKLDAHNRAEAVSHWRRLAGWKA